MESKPKSEAWITPKTDEFLTEDQMKRFIAYLDKNVPVPTKNFNWTTILDEGGFINFDVYIKWYKISLGWNQILFGDAKKEHLKSRRELFKSKDPADHKKWKAECMGQAMREFS
jgi:hypothetical protein